MTRSGSLRAALALAASNRDGLRGNGCGRAGQARRIITIASGQEWALVTHRKNGRLCLAYGSAGVEADGCAVASPSVQSVLTLAPARRGRARLIGLVSPKVARVEVRMRNGKTVHGHIYRLAPSLGTPLRAHVAEIPSTSQHHGATVIARTQTGTILRRIRI